MRINPPKSLGPTYLVGITDRLGAITSGVTGPSFAYVDGKLFAFSDPGRAGKCLRALCAQMSVRAAVGAALGSGCAPADDAAASLAAVCRPGDMWAVVCYAREGKGGAEWSVVTRPCKGVTSLAPPLVVYGFFGDLTKSYHELPVLGAAEAAEISDTFFSLGMLSRLG